MCQVSGQGLKITKRPREEIKPGVWTKNLKLKRWKWFSASLIIREMQAKATMRNYLTPVKMDILKRQEITMLTRMWKKRSPCVLWKYNCCHCGNSMETSQKTKNRATIWYRNSTSGNLSKENEKTNKQKTLIQKDICTQGSLQHYLQ